MLRIQPSPGKTTSKLMQHPRAVLRFLFPLGGEGWDEGAERAKSGFSFKIYKF
jgi:hypothetical protein